MAYDLNKKGQPIAPASERYPLRKDRRVYCEARTEASQRSGSWGGANQGCGNLSVTLTDKGYAACAVHRNWDRGWRR